MMREYQPYTYTTQWNMDTSYSMHSPIARADGMNENNQIKFSFFESVWNLQLLNLFNYMCIVYTLYSIYCILIRPLNAWLLSRRD